LSDELMKAESLYRKNKTRAKVNRDLPLNFFVVFIGKHSWQMLMYYATVE